MIDLIWILLTLLSAGLLYLCYRYRTPCNSNSTFTQKLEKTSYTLFDLKTSEKVLNMPQRRSPTTKHKKVRFNLTPTVWTYENENN